MISCCQLFSYYWCSNAAVDRLFSEQLAWAALLDAEESGLIRAASAMLRLAQIQKRWPKKSDALLEEISVHVTAIQDPLLRDQLTQLMAQALTQPQAPKAGSADP